MSTAVRARPRPIQVWRWLPGLAMALYGAAVLVRYGTPPLTVAAYGAAFVLLVTGPGLALLRAADTRSHPVAAELALGTATGLLWQLPGWALAVGTHTGPALLWVWSLLGYALALALPGPRRRVLSRRDHVPLHPVAAWTLAGCFAALTHWYSRLFAYALPPAPNSWYQDQYWHLALTGMLTRQVVPETPQVAGLPFVYHWLPNVHFAAMGLATGLDLPLVQMRLWVLPILATVLGLLAFVAHQLTGRGEAALVAGLLLTFRGNVKTASWFGLPGDSPLAVDSPSQTYAMVPWLVVLGFAVALLRRERLGAAWVIGGAALVVQPGMKSSHLPLLACAFALALAMALLRRRTARPAALGLALTLAALATVGRVLGGGAGGVHYQVGSTIRRLPVWASFTGLTPAQVDFPSGTILTGLDAPGAPLLLAALVLAYGAKYAFAAPAAGRLARLDPVAGFLLGLGLAGFAAMMIIDHDGQSQIYFMSSGVVGLQLLAAWGLSDAWRAAAASGWARWAAVGTGVAGLALAQLPRIGPATPPDTRVVTWVALPALIVAGIVTATLVAAALLRRRERVEAAGLVSLALGSILVVASLVPGWSSTWSLATNAKLPATAVTAAETAAAQWVRDHTPRADLVATNVHCMDAGQPAGCDARAFWVGALTERQQLVESWGYTDAAHEMHGRDGRRYARQPFADQELYGLNESAFANPTAATLDALRARGVRWLFADRHRATASPTLAGLAETAYENADVVVYRLG